MRVAPGCAGCGGGRILQRRRCTAATQRRPWEGYERRLAALAERALARGAVSGLSGGACRQRPSLLHVLAGAQADSAGVAAPTSLRTAPLVLTPLLLLLQVQTHPSHTIVLAANGKGPCIARSPSQVASPVGSADLGPVPAAKAPGFSASSGSIQPCSDRTSSSHLPGGPAGDNPCFSSQELALLQLSDWEIRPEGGQAPQQGCRRRVALPHPCGATAHSEGRLCTCHASCCSCCSCLAGQNAAVGPELLPSLPGAAMPAGSRAAAPV